MSSPSATFVDQAKANDLARLAFRGVIGGVRVASAFAPRLSNALIEAVVDRVPDLVTMGGLTIISNLYGNPAAPSRRARSTGFRWACRCSPPTIATPPCSMWPWRSSVRWAWPRSPSVIPAERVGGGSQA